MRTDLGERVATTELACIAAAVHRRCYSLLGDIPSEWFGDDERRAAWDALRALYRETGHADEVSVTIDGRVPTGLLRAAEPLAGLPDPPEALVRELRAAHTLARALDEAHAAGALFAETAFRPGEASMAMAKAGAGLGRLSAELAEDRGRTESLREAVEAFVEAEVDPDSSWRARFGLPSLDEALGGGVRAGEVCIVIGRSGHGKSSMALTASLHAATAGERVLYLSAEMSRPELAARFAAAHNDVPLSDLRTQLAAGDAAATAMAYRVADLPIDIRDTELDIDAIASIVDRAKLDGAPYRLVVLDFLQLFHGPGKERHEQLEAIAYTAKLSIAMRCQAAVIALAQPNREGSKAEGLPGMSSIRGSSAIENAADSIISIGRGNPIGECCNYPLSINVAKARNGRPGGFEGTQFFLGYGTFLASETPRFVEEVIGA